MISNVINDTCCSLDTAMKAEKEAMKTTVNGIEDRVPTIRKNIEALVWGDLDNFMKLL